MITIWLNMAILVQRWAMRCGLLTTSGETATNVCTVRVAVKAESRLCRPNNAEAHGGRRCFSCRAWPRLRCSKEEEDAGDTGGREKQAPSSMDEGRHGVLVEENADRDLPGRVSRLEDESRETNAAVGVRELEVTARAEGILRLWTVRVTSSSWRGQTCCIQHPKGFQPFYFVQISLVTNSH